MAMTPEQKAAEAARYKANKLKYGTKIADVIRAEAKITASMPKKSSPGARDVEYYRSVAEKSPKIAATAKAEAKITADLAKKKAAKKAAEAAAKAPKAPKAPSGGGMRGPISLGGSGGLGKIK
jgi:hypothetical protein